MTNSILGGFKKEVWLNEGLVWRKIIMYNDISMIFAIRELTWSLTLSPETSKLIVVLLSGWAETWGRPGSGTCWSRPEPGSKPADGSHEGHAGKHPVPGSTEGRQPRPRRGGVELRSGTRAEEEKIMTTRGQTKSYQPLIMPNHPDSTIIFDIDRCFYPERLNGVNLSIMLCSHGLRVFLKDLTLVSRFQIRYQILYLLKFRADPSH